MICFFNKMNIKFCRLISALANYLPGCYKRTRGLPKTQYIVAYINHMLYPKGPAVKHKTFSGKGGRHVNYPID